MSARRFLAAPPTVIPDGATEDEADVLRFPRVPRPVPLPDGSVPLTNEDVDLRLTRPDGVGDRAA